MQALQYKIIRTETQYDRYCKILEDLLEKKTKNKSVEEEIDLLTLLIETWDEQHNSFVHEHNKACTPITVGSIVQFHLVRIAEING